MQLTTYGYIRVSTKDQNEDRQKIALLEARVTETNIISDKKSGKDFDRPGYRRLCKIIKPGGTLFIKSIAVFNFSYQFSVLWSFKIFTRLFVQVYLPILHSEFMHCDDLPFLILIP